MVCQIVTLWPQTVDAQMGGILSQSTASAAPIAVHSTVMAAASACFATSPEQPHSVALSTHSSLSCVSVYADLTYQFLSDTTAAIANPKAGGMSPTGLRASQIVDITLTILNTYWVGKMFQGGLKMLRKQNIDDPKYRSD